jgi:hypothetical protein
MGHRAEQPTLRRPAAQNAIVLEGAICLRSQAHTGDLKNGFMVYALRLFVKTTMTLSKAEQVARLVRKAGVFRPRELDGVGIPRQYLRQAKDHGLVRQVGRGLYVGQRPVGRYFLGHWRSNPHEFVQLRCSHALVEKTKLTFVSHFLRSVHKSSHCRAIQRSRQADALDSRRCQFTYRE